MIDVPNVESVVRFVKSASTSLSRSARAPDDTSVANGPTPIARSVMNPPVASDESGQGERSAA